MWGAPRGGGFILHAMNDNFSISKAPNRSSPMNWGAIMEEEQREEASGVMLGILSCMKGHFGESKGQGKPSTKTTGEGPLAILTI